MGVLHAELVRKIKQTTRRLIRSGKINSDQINAIVEEMYPEWLTRISVEVHTYLRATESEILGEIGRQTRAFERRNKRRWKQPLDQLKIMICIAEESADSLVDEWNKEHLDDPYTFGALNHLFVKSLLLSREIICLIEGGFADGALGRWRTLHETAATASFIAQNDELTAERFIAGFSFKSKKAMLQINEYAERAGLNPFSDEELQAANEECDELKKRLGEGLEDDWGWARVALGVKSKPNLFDIERETALDHWRPRYRWSSQNVHSGYRPPLSSLGMAESQVSAHLTGASNGGMVDPIHMTAISLSIAASSFLGRWPNTDRLVASIILNEISVDIGPLASQVEAASARRAMRRATKGDT